MSVQGWKLVAMPFVVMGLASPLVTSCRKQGTTDPEAAAAGPAAKLPCEEMKTGDFSTLQFLAAPDAGAPLPLGENVRRLLTQASRPTEAVPQLPMGGENMRRLLAQASRLAKTAPGLEKEIIDACAELGKAANVFEGELKAEPDQGHGAERVCNSAAGKVGMAFRAAKEAKVWLDLSIEPTRCFVDVEAARKCLADCGVPPLKGDVRPHCVGGEIDGTCQGRCNGVCLVPPGNGAGACHAVCSGKCDRDFRGTCGGRCSGTCDGAPTRGPRPCAGVCDGTCSDKAEGACAGRCDGQCSGGWEPRDASRCPGVCVGVCSGEVRDPLCSGEYTPPGVDPVCQAACAAASALSVRCEAPLVRVSVRGGKPTPELQKLLAGIQSAIPKLVRLQQGPAKKLAHAIDGAVTASIDWSNAYATAAPKPLACVRAAIDGMKDAGKWIELTERGTEAIAPAIKTEPPPPPKGGDDE